MATPKLTVVIVGGSIAGLGLANMLQLNNIDFVVLEAYPEIAPQVGASLGLLPHGNRILDQLGLFEKVLKLAAPVNHFNFRNENGVLLAEHKNTAQDFVQRHGYPVLFLDRQTVLKILYENIKDKTKILPNKRVVKVQLEQGGVKAITEDGHTYAGDILIGADGIHSTVRTEMWRLSEKASPGYVPASESTAIPCVYSCIFGISNPCPGIEPGSYHSVFRQHSSYLILGGLNSRCYWFRFMNNMKKTTGPDIPRYSKAQEEEAIRAAAGDHILPDLTFGDIVARKVSSALTPLEEYVYKKWHFDRILTIGDSCHKFEPISGYGGNAALETAAVFVNELMRSLKDSPSGRLSASQIQLVVAGTQQNREARAKKLVQDAHSQQRLEAMETPWDRFCAQHLLPRAPTNDVMYNMSRNVPSGRKLDMVDLPSRPKWIPFDDELCQTPKRRGKFGWFQIVVYISVAVLTYYGMWIRPESYGVSDHLNEIISTRSFSPATSAPLQTVFLGISSVDDTLAMLNAIFVPGIGRFYKSYWMLQLYFLGSLVQPITIWCIESCRMRNHLALISFVSVWSLLYQLRGVGVLMPIWFAAYTWKSDSDHYWWPLSREIPLPYAKSILPAVLIGYVVPTILMFWPWESLATVQAMTALWQPTPIVVQALATIFAFLCTSRQGPSHQYRVASAVPQDLRYLRTIYFVAFVLGMALHLGVVFTLATSSDPDLTFKAVFKPNFTAERQTHGEGLRNLWLPDFYGLFITSTFFCCAAVWDLNRVGKTSVSMYKACIVLLVATVLVGPGAAMVGCWYWRELAMAVTAPKESPGNLHNRKEKTS